MSVATKIGLPFDLPNLRAENWGTTSSSEPSQTIDRFASDVESDWIDTATSGRPDKLKIISGHIKSQINGLMSMMIYECFPANYLQ